MYVYMYVYIYLFEGICDNYCHHGPRRVWHPGSEQPWMPQFSKCGIFGIGVTGVPGAAFGVMKTTVLALLGENIIIEIDVNLIFKAAFI